MFGASKLLGKQDKISKAKLRQPWWPLELATTTDTFARLTIITDIDYYEWESVNRSQMVTKLL
jgi:hypothetical protein